MYRISKSPKIINKAVSSLTSLKLEFPHVFLHLHTCCTLVFDTTANSDKIIKAPP